MDAILLRILAILYNSYMALNTIKCHLIVSREENILIGVQLSGITQQLSKLRSLDKKLCY